MGLFFPNRVEFVVFDMFLAPFTFGDGGCAVGQRYLLSLCWGPWLTEVASIRSEASPKLLPDWNVGFVLQRDELGPECDCCINSLPSRDRLKAVLDLGLISAGIRMAL